MSAYAGWVFYTEDGGKSWEQQTRITAKNFYSVSFVDESLGWVVGDLGTILHTMNGGTVGYVEQLKPNSLSANLYPNPFNTSTSIEYELTQPEKVILTIYNQMGKQVYQQQESQSQGKQQIIWNAEGFADGIYYYRLQVGDEVANGKMVKVR